MTFKRALQRYGRTPPPETPFQRAGQVWDDRIGSARVQARNWRVMAFGCLILSGGLGGALAWQSMQNRIVPYVVAVDRLGEAKAIAPAARDYQATDAQIGWFLAHFIADVRGIPIDPVVMRRSWLEAYDFVTRRGALSLGDYARRADPFGHVGEHSVSVQVTSVVRASDTAFQVKWVETGYERGTLTGASHWTAILSIATRPPGSADILRRNPLGLYVDGIDWSQEWDGGAPSVTIPPPAAVATSAAPAAAPALPAVPPSPATQEAQP